MKLETFCSICDSEIDTDAGDIQGLFGITPIAFCFFCYSSIVDMVRKTNICICEEEE